MSLLQQIQDDILDQDCPLPSILRKAMVLATKLGCEELRAWVYAELNGYRGDEIQVPEYRTFQFSAFCNFGNGIYFYNGQPIPHLFKHPHIQEKIGLVTIIESIGELESIKSDAGKEEVYKQHLPAPLLPIISQYLGRTYFCMSAWIPIPTNALIGILDSVRTRLISFVLEIENAFPEAKDLSPIGKINPAVTSQIFDRCIMHNYKGTVQNFKDINGSQIATDNARISSSSASYTSYPDAAGAIASLKAHLDSVLAEQRDDVQGSIDLLIRAIEDNTVPKSQVMAAAEKIAGSSPQMDQSLREIFTGTVSGVSAAGIWECVRLALNIQ